MKHTLIHFSALLLAPLAALHTADILPLSEAQSYIKK